MAQPLSLPTFPNYACVSEMCIQQKQFPEVLRQADPMLTGPLERLSVPLVQFFLKEIFLCMVVNLCWRYFGIRNRITIFWLRNWFCV